MSKRKRDNQRSKVYASETAVFKWGEELTLDEVKEFVHEVWNYKPLRVRRNTYVAPYNKPSVGDGRGTRRALSYGGRVSFPKKGRAKWIVLHELAHEITSYDLAAHGPEFCGHYLWLIEAFLGFEARETLAASFRKHRVKIKN